GLVDALNCSLCVLHGAGLILLLSGLTGEVPPFWTIVGANAAAWLVGFAVPVAPGGIGVREGMLCLALGSTVPVETAALVALLWRCTQVLVEFCVVMPLAIERAVGRDSACGESDRSVI
ncbi:MAG: uncharacterized membrane protein YbhN (UPF0104 family), partial [Candidatus Paceibacteria bacterium]